MLTTLPTLLARAQRYRYAIPAFNVTNLETIQAILSAAVKTKSPVIIQTSSAAIEYAGLETLLGMMESLASSRICTVPVVTHLDHGKRYDLVASCVKAGYTSVHMDASERPWKENIRLTHKAVVLGHKHRITVQGELGYLLGYEGMTSRSYSRATIEQSMTDPDQAIEFVQRTGVDTLAVAIGTAHGFFAGKERIDFQRLDTIARKVKKPIVLHGGSGVPASEIRKAIRLGIRIINIDTVLRLRFMDGLSQSVKKYDPKKKVDIRTHLAAARLTMEREAIKLITLLGSARQA